MDPTGNPSADETVASEDNLVLPKFNKASKGIGRRNTEPALQGNETIRTHLQKKRASINQNIGHEVHLKKGAKRLIRVSSDLKSRETAILETHYSDSKIQLLQQELAEVNNSLQAYQDESVRGVQIPLVPLQLKTSTKINFIKSFSDFITKHYYEDPGRFQEPMYEFSDRRLTMCNPLKSQSGIDSMYDYYSQLYLVGKRFFSSSDSCQLVFIWYDAVNGIPAAQKSVAFEKSSVLFNIGAMHTQCAARQKRNTLEDIDLIMVHLRKAAGVFEYIRDNLHKSPTLDMNKVTLDYFIVLMKAQYELLTWEKEVLGGLKTDLQSLSRYALLTNTIASSYTGLRKTDESKEYFDYIPEAWAGIIKVHAAHMNALSRYYAALIHITIVRKLKAGDSKATTANTDLQDIIRSLYLDNTENLEEIVTIKIPYQVAIACSQLDVANLLHGDSVRYEKQSKPLQSILFLHKKLSEDHERSLELMAEAARCDKGPSVMAPTLCETEIEFRPILPEFQAANVKDLFHYLGPLPTFSGANNWEAPRCVKVKKSDNGFGFSVRSSKPVRISGVDEDTEAEVSGMKVDDYVFTVNEKEAIHMSHSEVVNEIKQSKDYVTLTLSTPTGMSI